MTKPPHVVRRLALYGGLGTLAVWTLVKALDWSSEEQKPTRPLHQVEISPSLLSSIPTTQSEHEPLDGPATKSRPTSLSEAEIVELGRLLRESEDKSERRRAFDRLMAGLTKENALRIREQIAHLSPDSAEYRGFHHAWGRVAGKEAVLEAGRTTRQATVATIAGWASDTPADSIEFFEGLQKSAHNGNGTTNYFSQEYLRLGLVQGLAEASTQLATNYVQEQFASKEVGDKKVGDMIRTVARQVVAERGMDDAANWASHVPRELRNEALAGVARERAESDATATLNWLDSLGDEVHKGAAYFHTFNTWAGNDPTAAAEYIATMPDSYGRHEAVIALALRTVHQDASVALEWAESITDPAYRHRGFSDTFNSWSYGDITAASAYLAEMPNSIERDHAINGFAGGIAKKDPTAAVAWADQIQDQTMRDNALTTVALSFMETDPKSAVSWLPESGLPDGTIERVLDPSPDDLHYMKFLSQ